MTEMLDDQYLDWLYEIVGRQAENREHYHLIRQLYSREFVMLVPGDDNRAQDGIELRHEFMRRDRMIKASKDWVIMGCTVLEMLIGVSRRIAFELGGGEDEWFWHLIDNLGLTRYHDGRWNGRAVDQVIERLVWRQYSFDGSGGMFPLKEPHEDQRYVELWFQMESYMLEYDMV